MLKLDSLRKSSLPLFTYLVLLSACNNSTDQYEQPDGMKLPDSSENLNVHKQIELQRNSIHRTLNSLQYYYKVEQSSTKLHRYPYILNLTEYNFDGSPSGNVMYYYLTEAITSYMFDDDGMLWIKFNDKNWQKAGMEIEDGSLIDTRNLE